MSDHPKDVVPRSLILPFSLITICFALWGFANDITNPMVASFSTILLMKNWQGALIQMAFYGGYFAMAFPAALYIKKYSYKSGILVGLGLYAAGAFLFIPASMMMSFIPFLLAYFVMTCGLSFLETSANPYILSMGAEETATRRLNFAQAFNPIGSLIGMYTAKEFILAKLNKASFEERFNMDPELFNQIKAEDLAVVRNPYVGIGLVILVVLIVIAVMKMPKPGQDHDLHFKDSIKRLLKNKRYYEGVIAQFFYVGAQILCWTFIIHYGMHLGLTRENAQMYNIIAMVLFASSRFICTYLMKFFTPGKLLQIFATGALVLVLGVITIPGMIGIYCLVGISAFMSLMFPTIYGIALQGVGEDAKFGAAGLIMAILGGSVLPPLQGLIIDQGSILSFPAVRVSFVIPLICFAVVMIFGYRSYKVHIKNV